MKFYNKNPRRITLKQLEQLKANIQELGDLSGIVHDLNTDEIISGNQRSKVIDINKCEVVITEKYDTPNQQGTVAWGYVIFEGQKLNYRQVRWDERQREKTNITANALGGDWDYDILKRDFRISDLTEWGLDDIEKAFDVKKERKEINEDKFKICQTIKTDIIKGDMFQIGNHRLICGDSKDEETIKNLLGGEHIDLIITDPPYNVDYGKKNEDVNKAIGGGRFGNPYQIKNDVMPGSEFYQFLRDAFANIHNFISKDCPLYVFYAHIETLNFYNAINDAGFNIKQTLIWVKEHFVIGRQDYQWKHEPIIYGWSKTGKHYWCGDRNHVTVYDNSEDLRKWSKSQLIALVKEFMNQSNTDVIYCNKPQASSEHPTMKPVKLYGELIQNSSRENDIVLDAFAGSGTALIACEQLNRKARLVELDPVFCQIIIDRAKKFNPNIQVEKIGNIYDSTDKPK